MSKDTKIVHFQVIGGNKDDIVNLSKALQEMKERTNLDIQFLVTNERVELNSVKYLIDELYKIYKMNEKLKEKKCKV